MLAFALAGAAAPAADDPNPAKAEADLKAVRSQIDKVRAEMERDAGRRDKLAREIEESERDRGRRAQRARKAQRASAPVHTARRAELAEQRRGEESVLVERSRSPRRTDPRRVT